MEEIGPKIIQYGSVVRAKCNNVVPRLLSWTSSKARTLAVGTQRRLILLHNFWLCCKPLVFHALEHVCCTLGVQVFPCICFGRQAVDRPWLFPHCASQNLVLVHCMSVLAEFSTRVPVSSKLDLANHTSQECQPFPTCFLLCSKHSSLHISWAL